MEKWLIEDFPEVRGCRWKLARAENPTYNPATKTDNYYMMSLLRDEEEIETDQVYGLDSAALIRVASQIADKVLLQDKHKMLVEGPRELQVKGY